MGVLKRLQFLTNARVNDLVDGWESPELMLRQAIREMERSLEDVSAATARAIAEETLLEREAADQERQIGAWQARAECAVAAGDDELARQALARKDQHERLAAEIGHRLATVRDACGDFRQRIAAMRADYREARTQLAVLDARRRVAEARLALAGSGFAGMAPAGGFGLYDRIRARVELAEAEAAARADLDRDGADRIADAFEERETSARIEAALAAIKERIVTPGADREDPGPVGA